MKNDYFFVYETTNLINGKKYRCIHKTKNINDKYLGSGTTFVNSIKKYGKDNFKREILEFCDSYNELLEREKFYVNDEWIKDRTNYNKKTGGQSAGILSDESKNKISKTLKEKYQRGELVATIGEWIKENGTWISNGGVVSEESKENSSKSAKERYKNDENHPLKLYPNRIVSDEQKKKTSETLKEMYKTGDRVAKHDKLSEEHKNKISESLYIYYKNEVHHSKGKSPWNKGIPLKKSECPHCGKFVDKGNGNRWHFDNCKLKNRHL